MTLDDQQKELVRNWIQDGLQLNEIQKKLVDELDITMTYMDLRFLISDLEVTPKDIEVEPEPEEEAEPEAGNDSTTEEAQSPASESDAQQDPLPQDEQTPDGGGPVSVSVDSLTRPGYAISGKVTFSDGKKAEWFIDQMGRPGINPEEEGYRPSQEDIMKFQVELQNILSKGGM